MPTADLFDRYLAGDASLEEIAQVQQWLANFSDHQEAVVALRTMRSHQQAASWNAQARWQAVSANLADQANAQKLSLTSGAVALPGRNTVWQRFRGTREFMAMAAAVILAIVGITSWQLNARTNPRDTESTIMSTYTTANGERATIKLPDGSRVTLNVGSRLEVPANFGDATRTVQLDGEAVFDVEQAVGTPFVVLAGPSAIRVLGTRFLVRHYTADSSATISVQSGRVAVGETVLDAQQQATVSASRLVTMTAMEPERFSFIDGFLQFDGATLATIIPDLNRWYDADIRLGDEQLRSRIVVGGFPSGSVTDLVAALEWTFNVRVTRNGRTLTLYSEAQ